MSKTRINYKSDLPPIAVTFKLGQLSIDVPTHDFVVRFFVEGAPGKSFVCSYLDGVYKNCEKTDSTTLTCYIDNHGFQPGRLCCEYVSLDKGAGTGGKYADGVYKVVTPSRLDIILIDGPSDTATTVVADASVDLSEIVSDIDELQGDVRDILIALDGKLDYYDASWASAEGTADDFNALMSAILAGTPVLYDGVLVNAMRRTSSRITLTYDNGKYVNVVDIVKDGDDITITYDSTTLATAGDLSTVSSAVTSLGSRVTTAEGNITSLGNRLTTAEGNITSIGNRVTTTEGDITSLGTRMTTAEGDITSIQNDLTGSGTTIPRFHSASWLETEEGVYDQSHPERRAKVRYTSMLSAITGERKLIKLKNITATGVETGEGWISLSFVSTDTTGKTNNVVYIVRYTSGAAYCTVEKRVVPIPFYDATWVLGYGSRDQMDELINVIQGSPKDIIMVDKSPVLWAARRTNDMVELAIMQSENTIRVYTVEYNSGAGETSKTYTDFEIQEALVSGTSIKTINNQSLLGSGNITIQGGSGSAVQSDWAQSDSTAVDYIKNKPTIPAAQVQSNWNEASSSSKAYIQNKPTIPTVPTNVSAFTNDAGYLNNNFCPIIEDTRSSAVAAITGVAPFASLVDGQRIVFHFKYNNAASPSLQLTLSGGTTTTYPLYQNYNNGVNALTLQAMPAGSYGEFVFDSTNSRWVLVGKDYNTTYSNTSQADINSAAQGSRLIEPKLIHDNAYIVQLAYSSGSLKANKMYDFGEVTSALTIPDLDVTNDLVSNAMNFWALHFKVGELTPAGTTELSITFPQNPSGIIVDDEPTIKEGDYVEIMITKHTVGNDTDYYASIKVWQAQQ